LGDAGANGRRRGRARHRSVLPGPTRSTPRQVIPYIGPSSVHPKPKRDTLRRRAMIPRPVRGLLFVTLALAFVIPPAIAGRGGRGGGGGGVPGGGGGGMPCRGGGGFAGGGGFSHSPAVSSPRPAQRPAVAGGAGGRPSALPSGLAGGAGRPGAGPAGGRPSNLPAGPGLDNRPQIGSQPGIGNRPGVGNQPGIGNRPGIDNRPGIGTNVNRPVNPGSGVRPPAYNNWRGAYAGYHQGWANGYWHGYHDTSALSQLKVRVGKVG
jgi:hypothetical protein